MENANEIHTRKCSVFYRLPRYDYLLRFKSVLYIRVRVRKITVTAFQWPKIRKMLRSVKIPSTVYATHRENLHATQPKAQH